MAAIVASYDNRLHLLSITGRHSERAAWWLRGTSVRNAWHAGSYFRALRTAARWGAACVAALCRTEAAVRQRRRQTAFSFALRTSVHNLNSMPPCLSAHSQRPLCNCCHRRGARGQGGDPRGLSRGVLALACRRRWTTAGSVQAPRWHASYGPIAGGGRVARRRPVRPDRRERSPVWPGRRRKYRPGRRCYRRGTVGRARAPALRAGRPGRCRLALLPALRGFH